MCSFVRLFALKTWTEKRRHIFRNTFSTFVPIVFLVAIINTSQRKQTFHNDEGLEYTINQDDLGDYIPGELINKIYYTPRTNLTETIIEEVRLTLNIVDERLIPCDTETELEYALLDNQYLCYGIILHDVSAEGLLRYTLRTKNNNFRTDMTYSSDVFNVYKKRDNEYIESGFLALQNAIDRSFVSLMMPAANNGRLKPEHVSLRYGHIPVDERQSPEESTALYSIFIWHAAASSFACVYLLLLPLMEERAYGMGEHLKIACVASYWNEIMMFVINFAQFFITFLASAVACFVTGIFETNSAAVIYLVLLVLLYLVHLIVFTFFLSRLLESPAVAVALAPVYLYAPVLLGVLSGTLTFPLSVLPVNAYLNAGNIFVSYKGAGHLFEAGDLTNTAYPSFEGFSLFRIFLMQLFGILLWTFLWFYAANVFPGRYGTPKPKGFFLSANYWRGVRGTLNGTNGVRHTNKIMAESQREFLQHQGEPNTFELESRSRVREVVSIPVETGDLITSEPLTTDGKHLPPLVRIESLSKVFEGRWSGSRAKVAVKDFSISIYSHQITVLLGHNGAGKTTTMNIITGMVPRTSGSIVVDGEQDPDRYRQRIGFCPQHNVFYTFLNCREHVEFFGRLRGLTAEAARRETVAVLEEVNLLDKSDHFVHTLSGGMKRRLSLANAIIGHTKLLILDEPTSGLDPESRRDIWDLLLRLRKDHTILLTTHFMEEADILGDWIAIMEHGELVAFGTPMHLKQKYGEGYTLKLQKAPKFDAVETMGIVHRHVPNAIVRESVQEVFAVTLPYAALSEYPSLLGQLETKLDYLGIETVGITNATLEDVFLNSSKSNKSFQRHPESEDRVDSPLKTPPLSVGLVTGSSSRIQWAETLSKCRAIWHKKYIHVKCNKHVYGVLSILPAIAAVLSFWMSTGLADVATALPTVTLNAFDIRDALGVIAINHGPTDGTVHPWLSKEALRADASTTLAGMRLLVLENTTLEDGLKELIAKDYTAYRDQVVVGIECNESVDKMEITVLHNNNLWHSTGIGESMVATLLLRHLSGLPNALVEVQNIPSTRKLLIDVGTPYFFSELVTVAFMFYILLFMQVPLLENQTGFRQLQNINRYVYWGSTYAFDFLLYFGICTLVIILSISMDRNDAFSSSAYGQIFAVLLLYGMVELLVVYIISQCVQNTNTAITIMSYLVIVGVGGVFLLSGGYDDINSNGFSIGLLHLVPEFGFKHSMRVIYENQKLITFETHSKTNVDSGNQLQPLSLAKFYVTQIVLFVLLGLTLNEVVENIYRREAIAKMSMLIRTPIRNLVRRLTCRKAAQDDSSIRDDNRDEVDSGEGSYVTKENETVGELLDASKGVHVDREKYAILVRELRKSYDAYEAVNGISFTVKKGECFGLLGMNGAGKTTVFQMLSRNLPITTGQIYLQHFEVQQANAVEYRQQYGYCPQIDMLLDFMTVYQTIDYFARLKSLPSRKEHVNYWLAVLDILKYRDHTLSECSGGTKRKVNTILALLGGPPVVLLDEPTTGVDPKSRRFLWKCIKALQQKNQAILLTSHSMEECEELCNRLSIMVQGKLRCIGSILQLKARRGLGYNLLLRLNSATDSEPTENDHQTLIADVVNRFQAVLVEEHKGMLKFYVTPPVKLSEMFGRVNELKGERGEEFASFTISETSLEDIFLQFRHKIT